jgi:hypothetical protein
MFWASKAAFRMAVSCVRYCQYKTVCCMVYSLLVCKRLIPVTKFGKCSCLHIHLLVELNKSVYDVSGHFLDLHFHLLVQLNWSAYCLLKSVDWLKSFCSGSVFMKIRPLLPKNENEILTVLMFPFSPVV